MTKLSFGTKAQTLENLRRHLGRPVFCEQYFFNVGSWRTDPEALVAKLEQRFNGCSLAVRSSTQREDGWDFSHAGAFTSLINVVNEPDAVTAAVEEVIASYPADCDDDQVLIQPMVEDVVISGVIMTRELNTGSPYYTINYDDLSGRTDGVTGGAESKTLFVRRSAREALRSFRFRRLMEVVLDIERIADSSELDIEFAITCADAIFILQVRPMAVRKNWRARSDQHVDDLLDEARASLSAAMERDEGYFGTTSVFGEMPDWNPAEIIGSHPRPLALSLYERLVTDSTWSRSRTRVGYRTVPDQPLMIVFAGRPYIDVRRSLSSFIPLGVPDELADKLVSYQLEKLSANPFYHDKIEFEIALTCADFSLRERTTELLDAGFSVAEIKILETSLTRLTANVLKEWQHRFQSIEDELAGLRARPQDTAKARAMDLLVDCVPHGTLPFADAARYGFMAVSMLRSLVATGVFSVEESENFLRSVHTVASDILKDMLQLSSGEIELTEFLSRYGHLRPGTYDILSPRYDQRHDEFLGLRDMSKVVEEEPFSLTSSQFEATERLLTEWGYDCAPESFFEFIRRAIAIREKAKFKFTRHLSDALEALAEWGAEHDLSREDVAFLRIDQIEKETNLREQVDAARAQHDLTLLARLPHLLTDATDIDVVRMPLGRPNFITHDKVQAKTVFLALNEVVSIDGSIVLIESADPGFDWIFSHDIVGLITKYGGANSHIAIRCAEFGLPAAIGCGERMFGDLIAAEVVELNCENYAVRVVR